MRLPVNHSIESRDGTLDNDAKMVNVYKSVELGRVVMVTRPGISTRTSNLTGFGAGIGGQTTTLVFTSTIFGVLSSTSTVTLSSGISNPMSSLAFPYGRGTNGFGLVLRTGAPQIWWISDISTGTWTQLTTNAAGGGISATVNQHGAYTLNNTTVIICNPASTMQALTSVDQSSWAVSLLPYVTNTDQFRGFAKRGANLYVYKSSEAVYSSTPGIGANWTRTALSGETSAVRIDIFVGLKTSTFGIDARWVSSNVYRPGVWRAADGASFSFLTGTVPWSNGTPEGAVEYNSSLFVFDSENTGTVWTSEDGSNWSVYNYTTPVVPQSYFSINENIGPVGAHTSSVYIFTSTIVTTVPIYVSTVSTISNPQEVFVWSVEIP